MKCVDDKQVIANTIWEEIYMKIDNFNFAQGISYDSKTQQNSFKNFSEIGRAHV